MALRTPDLVRETLTTTGTGAYTPSGALPGFRSILESIATSDTFYYRVAMGTNWEIGIGTWNGTTVVRTTIILSTNANAAVNWAAGTKVIHSVAPEALLSTYFLNSGGTLTGDVIINKTAATLTLNSPTVSNKAIASTVADVNRWVLFYGVGTESGGNSGSNVVWNKYDDAGTLIGAALTMQRTGEAAFNGSIKSGAALTVRSIPSADSEGIFVQNQETSNDSSVSISLAGSGNAIRTRFRGQRIGATNNGQAVISAYTGGTEVQVAKFVNDGEAYHVGSGSKYDHFPPGTRLVFQQSTAPLGWTKDVSLNDRALRIVSGSVGNGGSTGFSSLFASRTPTGYVDYHVLTEWEMPSHTHEWPSIPGAVVTTAAGSGNISSGMGGGSQIPYTYFALNSKGGNAGHNHSLTMNAMDFAVAYTDVVVCQKD